MPDYEVVTSRNIADVQDRLSKVMAAGLRPVGAVAMLDPEEAGDDRRSLFFAPKL